MTKHCIYIVRYIWNLNVQDFFLLQEEEGVHADTQLKYTQHLTIKTKIIFYFGWFMNKWTVESKTKSYQGRRPKILCFQLFKPDLIALNCFAYIHCMVQFQIDSLISPGYALPTPCLPNPSSLSSWCYKKTNTGSFKN